MFLHACKMGLEGIVSKRLTALSGPSRDWLKIKNPDSPAMVRHREGRWQGSSIRPRSPSPGGASHLCINDHAFGNL